ncbi:MAG: c-type cytochrome [Planctomycetes bacterium]|nr:c-type cytochrome [Planctomycetota bacterium]
MKTKLQTISLLASILLGATACSGGEETAKPNTPPAAKFSLEPQADDTAAMKEAKTRFTTVCASCHGTTGMGDGVAAAALNPKPRSYSDQAWQASVTDEHLAKVIVEGGAAVGKSPMMTANGDLAGKKDVVDALVKIIRSYRK